MSKFQTHTVKYYRLAIQKFFPVVEKLYSKSTGKIKCELRNLIEMYNDVAKKIDMLKLNLEDPNRFYDDEDNNVELQLNDKNIENFSRLTLRLLREWEKEVEVIKNKDYLTQEDKDKHYKLKSLI
jgi:hypothetical protein